MIPRTPIRIHGRRPCEAQGMFGFPKKDPLAKLRKEYEACMSAALDGHPLATVAWCRPLNEA